jgi:hypothetical protein
MGLGGHHGVSARGAVCGGRIVNPPRCHPRSAASSRSWLPRSPRRSRTGSRPLGRHTGDRGLSLGSSPLAPSRPACVPATCRCGHATPLGHPRCLARLERAVTRVLGHRLVARVSDIAPQPFLVPGFQGNEVSRVAASWVGALHGSGSFMGRPCALSCALAPDRAS